MAGKVKDLMMILKRQSGCPTHCEAKQTETSEFGAEERILRSMQGDGCLEPLKPQALPELSAKPFSRKGEGVAGLAVSRCQSLCS